MLLPANATTRFELYSSIRGSSVRTTNRQGTLQHLYIYSNERLASLPRPPQRLSSSLISCLQTRKRNGVRYSNPTSSPLKRNSYGKRAGAPLTTRARRRTFAACKHVPPSPPPISPPALAPPPTHRDPDYNSDPGSIRSYRLRQSRTWRYCTAMAVVAYIAACFLGKPPFSADWAGMPTPSRMQQRMAQTWGIYLECGCVLFFAFDIYLLCRYSTCGVTGGGARGLVSAFF